ncbi:hypothetical protein TNCV_3345431 [Trichonephila clavipes]|nr:hypothetical protein TNCV_3345431 [Trichonephila clavipes]
MEEARCRGSAYYRGIQKGRKIKPRRRCTWWVTKKTPWNQQTVEAKTPKECGDCTWRTGTKRLTLGTSRLSR